MRRTIESIRRRNPFTIYGVLMLLLLAVFVGCMTYCTHIVLTDEGPEHEPVPWNSDYAKAWETHDTIKQGLSSPKGDK
jgi:hypothetical protein